MREVVRELARDFVERAFVETFVSVANQAM